MRADRSHEYFTFIHNTPNTQTVTPSTRHSHLAHITPASFTRFPDALPLIGHVFQRAAIGTISLREDSWWRLEWKKASTAAGAVAGSALAAPVDIFRTDAKGSRRGCNGDGGALA